MKKLFISLIAVLFALFYVSCSSGGNGNSNGNCSGHSSSSGGKNNLVENEQVYDYKTGNQYTGNGKVYMADIEIGTMNNGKISFTLPESIESNFLTKLDSVSKGLTVEPPGVETWFYTDPFKLSNNGEHIGDLQYVKVREDDIYHGIFYWYFSENTKMNGFSTEGGGIEYGVDAKKGWNKIHIRYDYNEETSYITTDLSEAPDGLKWFVWED